MWKLDRQDDRLLERFLRALQSRHVGPLYVRLLHHDRALQLRLQLLLLRIVRVRLGAAVAAVVLFALVVLGTAAAATVLDRLFLALLEVRLQLFRPVQILEALCPDRVLCFVTLGFICVNEK